MKKIDISARRLCIYLEGSLRSIYGKTGLAVLRYSEGAIVSVIDKEHQGQNLFSLTKIRRDVPIVASVEDSLALGADTLLIGVATSGGVVSPDLWDTIVFAVQKGMSIVNGLHEEFAPKFPYLAPNQVILDVRKPEKETFSVGFGRCLELSNKRILTVGTDMAIGKMSTCLELGKLATKRGIKNKFLATGQTGIMIDGNGIPLDAYPIDFASGAVEKAALELSAENCDLLFVEGQGSILNPASTATLPLIRGSQPTHMILVHKATQTHVMNDKNFPIPPLKDVARIYEDISSAGGTFPGAKVVGIALNTSLIAEDADALRFIEAAREATGLPTTDVVRFAGEELLDAIVN